MNTLKKYIRYLKDNPEGYWFKRKLYGWGWVPVTWQGWSVIVIFLLFVLSDTLSLRKTPTDSEVTWFIIKILFSITVLLFICYTKGEKPKWQWGFKHLEDKDI